MNAEARALRSGDPASEVVGSGARRGDDQDLGGRRKVLNERRGGIQARGSGERAHDFEHQFILARRRSSGFTTRGSRAVVTPTP